LAPVLRRNVEQSPDDLSARHELALALLLAGDLQGYRRACAATLERLGRSEDALIGEAARACVIGPDAVGDPSALPRLAATAVSREPNVPWWHYVLGLAEFRAGRYERAVEYAMKSIDLGPRWLAAPLNYPVLAMAHHGLGHRAEARRWLEKAHRWGGVASPGLRSADVLSSTVPWWDRVEFQLLLCEADGMVLDAAFPADPFAP
jgi:tetratricopeptide (TPR) repeat protein